MPVSAADVGGVHAEQLREATLQEGRIKPEQHPDRRGLPGAVRAQETEHLAGRHRQRQVRHCDGSPNRLVRPSTRIAETGSGAAMTPPN